MKTVTAIATAVLVLLSAGPAYADPPAPVQCRPVKVNNVCRGPDGSVTACNPHGFCLPVSMDLAPGFWDQP